MPVKQDGQSIYRLIPKVMEDVAFIPKLREHNDQHWMYRGFEDFLQYFRPALLKHGLSIVPEVLETETSERMTSKNNKMHHMIVRVAYTVFAPDGSCVRAVVVGESWDNQDNASTKALDDAFTSFLTQVFCVPVAENIEEMRKQFTGAGKQRREPAPPSPPPAPKTPPPPSKPPDPKHKEACTKLRRENTRLGFNEDQLRKWLSIHFIMSPSPMTLAYALDNLTTEQIEEAVKLFEAKKKAPEEKKEA